MRCPSVLIVLLSLLLLGACMPFRYAVPQPARGRELSAFPQRHLGLYISDDGDSLLIAKDHFCIGADEPFILASEDVVLKRMRRVYVISVKHFLKTEDTEDYLGWEVVPAVFRHDSLFVSFLPAVNDEVEKMTYESIKGLTDIEVMDSTDHGYYLINDRRRAFKVLWKHGMYGEAVGYKRQ